MRALVQRVLWAEVEVASQVVGRIERGLLVYLGVATTDTPALAHRLAEKTAHLRIFEDQAGKLNRSVQETGGGILAISNFTLLADTAKGRRPAFCAAAGALQAQPLYDAFVGQLKLMGCTVACGVFRADMTIRSAADGPVNVIVDWPPLPQPSPPASEAPPTP